MDTKDFYVVAVVTNPERYKRRIHLFKQFLIHMQQSGLCDCQVVVVEGVQGDRPFEVTDPANPLHVQKRLSSVLWHKENLINIGLHHLSNIRPGWKYVAWIDGDVEFLNKSWVQDAIHELQINPIIQLWSHAVFLGPKDEVLETYTSFAKCYKDGHPYKCCKDGHDYSDTPYWHPGYAWAATRECVDGFGALIDRAIVGSADTHMATAMIGRDSVPEGVSEGYRKMVREWGKRAVRTTHKHLGCINGTLVHYFHGKKADRRYRDRWQILKNAHYDPERHVHYNSEGVLEIHPEHTQLVREIRLYFQGRNEDSIDVD